MLKLLPVFTRLVDAASAYHFIIPVPVALSTTGPGLHIPIGTNAGGCGSVMIVRSAVAEAATLLPGSLAPQPILSAKEATPAPAIPAPASTLTSTPAPTKGDNILYKQRIAETRKVISKIKPGNASIQLYYTSNVLPSHIEGFLERADTLGILNQIYILPIKINGRKGLRVLYGIYPNSEDARSGITKLPERYLNAFAPAIYLLE